MVRRFAPTRIRACACHPPRRTCSSHTAHHSKSKAENSRSRSSLALARALRHTGWHMSAHGYRVGRSHISLHLGDLASSTAEVLVSSDDVRLTMSGGVSEAINRASGGRLRQEINKLIPAQVGDVVVSSAAAHATAKYILHGCHGRLPAVLASGLRGRAADRRASDAAPSITSMPHNRIPRARSRRRGPAI